MARTSPHAPQYYDLDDCFCPVCGRIWGSRSHKLPAHEGFTEQGRAVCVCVGCRRKDEAPRGHKDLPGQRTFF